MNEILTNRLIALRTKIEGYLEECAQTLYDLHNDPNFNIEKGYLRQTEINEGMEECHKEIQAIIDSHAISKGTQ